MEQKKINNCKQLAKELRREIVVSSYGTGTVSYTHLAIVPLNPSGMKLMIYVIVFVLFSITTTIVWKFLVKNILKIIITNV